MSVSYGWRKIARTFVLALLLACPVLSKADQIIEIPGLVVFDEPQFSPSFVDISLRLTQSIPDARGGFIVLTGDSPQPTNVFISSDYQDSISRVSLTNPGLLQIDVVGPALEAGTLLTWRFSPIPMGQTVALLTSVSDPVLGVRYLSAVGTLNELAQEDTYPFRAERMVLQIPEPGSWFLMLSGLMLISLLRCLPATRLANSN